LLFSVMLHAYYRPQDQKLYLVQFNHEVIFDSDTHTKQPMS